MSDWRPVCKVDEVPRSGARVFQSTQGPIAVFRNETDEIFALLDSCPHRGAPLSKGIVSGRTVICTRHDWDISLENGNVLPPYAGCVRSFPVKVQEGSIFLSSDITLT